MKRLMLFGLILVLTAGFAVVSNSEEAVKTESDASWFAKADMAEKVRPCKEDVMKLCKGTMPGKGRIMSCLKSHEAEVSEACKTHISGMREKITGFMKACKADTKNFCKGVKMGKGRIASCLKSHEAELSEGCKAFFAK